MGIRNHSSGDDLVSLAWGLTAEEGLNVLRSLLADHRTVQGVAKAYPLTFGTMPAYTRAKVRIFLDAYRGLIPHQRHMEIVR